MKFEKLEEYMLILKMKTELFLLSYITNLRRKLKIKVELLITSNRMGLIMIE